MKNDKNQTTNMPEKDLEDIDEEQISSDPLDEAVGREWDSEYSEVTDEQDEDVEVELDPDLVREIEQSE